MESSLNSIPIILFYLLPLAICTIFLYTKYLSTKTCNRPPEANGAWPVVGHMPLLNGGQQLHLTLASLADKYGEAFTIRIGYHRALVISSWEMAKECFTVHDKAFSGRPSTTQSKLLGYNYAMFGFGPYGTYWRELRKIATIELLSNHRIDMLKHIFLGEVKTAIKELHSFWMSKESPESGVLVEMKQWFGDLTHNISVRMVGGKRYFGPNADCGEEEARKCQKVMRNYSHLFGAFVLSDAIPFLGWLDYKGYKKAMRKSAKELDIVIGGWLEEHKQRKLLGQGRKDDQDFMDVLLTILENAKISGFDTDTIVKATCLNIILASSDGAMVTLTWALSLLLNHQDALKKVQEELNIHVNKDRQVCESDLKNLVYLQAVIKETLRIYPAGQVIGFRASMEDCTLSSGYHIPAGTRLLVNLYKIQRDERVWPNPHEFQPERFLTSLKGIDVRGQNFELIPFGAGRRSCPGISLALQVVQLALATLLHSFEVGKSSNQPIDMSASAGMTNLKAAPLEVLLKPRLRTGLYM